MTSDLAQVMEATWPPARSWNVGPFVHRDGDCGGKRVSAASCDGGWAEGDLDRLQVTMTEPLVMVRSGQDDLDQALAARGWRKVDPVVAYAAPIFALTADLPPLPFIAHWPPPPEAVAIWQDGGLGPARMRVMERVQQDKAVIVVDLQGEPAGVGFVAGLGREAMLHALEVQAKHRRHRVGEAVVRGAAAWAGARGAVRLSLVVTEQNHAARALYHRLGMQVVGQYHYRQK